MKYTIYALVCPNSKSVRYIGYTSKELHIRLRYHYYDGNKGVASHKVNFLKSVLPKQVEIVAIEENINTEDEAAQREIFWISKYDNLTNSTTGGEKSKAYREDVRKKMSESRKGKLGGVNNPMYGKKRPDVALRNKIVNPESGKKTGDTLRILYSSPEYRKLHQQIQTTCKRLKSVDIDGKETFYNSAREAARAGFERKSIYDCLKGNHKQHKGFIWEVA